MKDSLMPTFEASSLIERVCYAACMPAMVLWMFTQSEGHRIEQAPGQPGVKRLLINKFGQIDEVGAVHYWLSTHGFIWLPAILFLGLIACGSARRRSDRL